MIKESSNFGYALYLTVVFLVLTLGVILGVSSLLVIEIKNTRELANSVQAFFSADAGLERALFQSNALNEDLSSCSINSPCQYNLDPKTKYYVIFLRRGEGNCPGSSAFCLEALGSYKGTRRGLRAVQ